VDLERFTRDIEQTQARLVAMYEHATSGGNYRAMLKQAFAELDTSLEELRAAEEELRIQNEQLVAMEQATAIERQRYQELFENAPDGYLVASLDRVIKSANQAATQLLNMDSQNLVGLPLISFAAEEDLRRSLDQLSELRQTPQHMVWDMRLQPYKAEQVDVAVAVRSVRGSNGNGVNLLWLLRSVISRNSQSRYFARVKHATAV
jgi:PAS domain S-box-containing protein